MSANYKINENNRDPVLPEEDEIVLKQKDKNAEKLEKPKYLFDALAFLRKIKIPLPDFLFSRHSCCERKHYHPCAHHIISGTLDAFSKGYLLKAFFSTIFALIKLPKSRKK